MNITDLKKVLNLAEPFLMQSDFIPILQHFWFHPKHITAYNDIQCIQLAFPSDLHCAVPGKIFTKLLSTITATEVDVEMAGDKLLVGSGRNQSKLPTLSKDDFVFAFPTPTGTKISLDPDLSQGLEKCLTTVSHNPTHPERNGITFKITNDSLTLFTTDGKTISRFTAEGNFKIPPTDELWVILPTFFCEQLNKLMKEFKVPAELYFDESSATAILGSNKIFSRLINAKPAAFEQAIKMSIPDLEETLLFGIPDELGPALDRAVLMLNPEKNIKNTSITVSPSGQMELLTESDFGKSDDSIDIPQLEGMEYSIITEPTLMQRACQICDEMTLTPRCFMFATKGRKFHHLISIKAS